MPFKDPERKREYQRNWVREKRRRAREARNAELAQLRERVDTLSAVLEEVLEALLGLGLSPEAQARLSKQRSVLRGR